MRPIVTLELMYLRFFIEVICQICMQVLFEFSAEKSLLEFFNFFLLIREFNIIQYRGFELMRVLSHHEMGSHPSVTS